MREEYALVCGTAVVDVIANIETFNPPFDHVGPINIEFGGCAYNMAINLQMLGTPTTFFSAMSNSPFSKLCVNQLQQNNVRTAVKFIDGLPDSVYAGIFHNGEQTTAVSTSSIENIKFRREDYQSIVESSYCVIITCDISIDVINEIVALANTNKIPVFISGISKNKALIIPQIIGHIDYCFLNSEEMDHLCNTYFQTNDWILVSEKLDTAFIVMMGQKGVAIVSASGREVHTTDSIAITGNTRGAGELLMSCVVNHHIFQNMDIHSSIELSFGLMDEIFNKSHANLGTDKSFATNIESVFNTAQVDELTGAYNRHGLESVYSSFTEQDMVYILIIDIDHFKDVNDTFGHDVGDIILKETANIVTSTLREQDVFARWGGEEFICLIRADSIDGASRLSQRIRENVELNTFSAIDRKITISGGISKIDINRTLSEGVAISDKLLYEAKESGRNKILPEPSPSNIDFDKELDSKLNF
ncbi:MAG: PfkB family carbohydrate kinase [Methylococcales bacterium]